MGIDIDTTDERIIYHLANEARHTSAPDIAEELGLSPPTIRNRIRRLEEAGVLEGYHAHVDYERIEGRLTNLFLCTATTTDRKRFAQRVLDVPGVVNVREVMTGEEDLHVKVVGTDTDDVRRIAKEISMLGVHIDDEDLLHREHFRPYEPFAESEAEDSSSVTGVADLSDEADVVEITVTEDAPVAGMTLERAADEGLVPANTLVISINREDRDYPTTPSGETTIRPGDLVSLFSRTGITKETLRSFTN